MYGEINFNDSNPSGSKYNVIAGRGEHPANFVSWYDAIRFTNWLNNGQGNSDTETGAYTLGALGAGGIPITPPLTHNAGSQIWLPTENEWYKAAFYDPRTSAQGGPPLDSHYWLYPTSSNTLPIASVPMALPNHANYIPGGTLGGPDNNLTDVGAYAGTKSFYGTFDQGGNVFQFNEAVFTGGTYPVARGVRGGSWAQSEGNLLSSSRFSTDPSVEAHYSGFRVASVPEPSTFALAVLGVLTLLGISSAGDQFAPQLCCRSSRRPSRPMPGLSRFPPFPLATLAMAMTQTMGIRRPMESRVLALSPTTTASAPQKSPTHSMPSS